MGKSRSYAPGVKVKDSEIRELLDSAKRDYGVDLNKYLDICESIPSPIEQAMKSGIVFSKEVQEYFKKSEAKVRKKHGNKPLILTRQDKLAKMVRVSKHLNPTNWVNRTDYYIRKYGEERVAECYNILTSMQKSFGLSEIDLPKIPNMSNSISYKQVLFVLCLAYLKKMIMEYINNRGGNIRALIVARIRELCREFDNEYISAITFCIMPQGVLLTVDGHHRFNTILELLFKGELTANDLLSYITINVTSFDKLTGIYRGLNNMDGHDTRDAMENDDFVMGNMKSLMFDKLDPPEQKFFNKMTRTIMNTAHHWNSFLLHKCFVDLNNEPYMVSSNKKNGGSNGMIKNTEWNYPNVYRYRSDSKDASTFPIGEIETKTRAISDVASKLKIVYRNVMYIKEYFEIEKARALKEKEEERPLQYNILISNENPFNNILRSAGFIGMYLVDLLTYHTDRRFPKRDKLAVNLIHHAHELSELLSNSPSNPYRYERILSILNS